MPQTLTCSQIIKNIYFATSSISCLVFRGLRQSDPLKCEENVLVTGLVFVFDKCWLMLAFFFFLMTFLSLIMLDLYNLILISQEPSENMKTLCKKSKNWVSKSFSVNVVITHPSAHVLFSSQMFTCYHSWIICSVFQQ